VEAFESVSVTAGTFEAFRIVCRVHGRQEGGLTTWWAPDVRGLVKSGVPGGPAAMSSELVTYTLR
jgi:hypothetical protein